MKINAIKSICKQSSTIFIMDDLNGRQWLGTENAVYAVESGLKINQYNVSALFDFTDAEADSFRIYQANIDDERYQNDPMPGEGEPCSRYPLLITAMGGTYIPLGTPQGMLFLDIELIKPIERKNVPLECYVREADGKPLLLAIYRDMAEVAALVKPMSGDLAEDLLTRLRGVFAGVVARDTKDKPEDGRKA